MSTFTLSLKLNTSASDEAVLMERFYQGFLMYNRLVSHARKRLRGLRQDKRYRAAMDSYRKGERFPDGTEDRQHRMEICGRRPVPEREDHPLKKADGLYLHGGEEQCRRPAVPG